MVASVEAQEGAGNLMGYWGYGPFDNDGAADLVAGLMRPVENGKIAKGRFSPAKS